MPATKLGPFQKEAGIWRPRKKLERPANQPPARPQQAPQPPWTTSALLSLFFGLYHQPQADSDPDRGSLPTVRCLIGEGNNQPLVTRLLKERRPVEIENFFTRSNFIWTQKLVSKFDPMSVARLDKCCFLKKLSLSDTVFQTLASHPAAVECFVAELTARKLFRASDSALLALAFQELLQDRRIVGVTDKAQLAAGNHIKGLKHISRKALLASTITERCRELQLEETEVAPKTFIVRGDRLEEGLASIASHFGADSERLAEPLIVKPGEFSNRGNGILMAYSLSELRSAVSKVLHYRKSTESAIVQSYLSRPLLFKDRKFDIRCFALVTKFFHSLHFFWYLDGYARTSSFSYDADVRDNLKVHLTNEAVQVKGNCP